jgi:hypothetical protein
MDACAVLDVLALARAFVEAGWCKGSTAEAADGESLWWCTSAPAVRFCAYGAIGRAGHELDAPDRFPQELVEEACWQRHQASLDDFNDDPATTRRQVLALFDAAAARVGKG